MPAWLKRGWRRSALVGWFASVNAVLAVAEGPPVDAHPSVPPPGPKLIERAFDNLYAHDFVQTLSLTTSFRGGQEITRRIQIMRKQSVSPGKALVRFLDPPDIRKTSMLLVQRVDRFDDIYLYLPAFRVVRHVAASQRLDSFFGTNITYEDLEPKRATDFEARTLGWDSFGEIRCARVELRAREGIESSYSHVEACIEPARAVILRSEYYRDGEALKRMEVDPTSIRSIGGTLIPHRARIASAQGGIETELAVESYQPSNDIPDELFSLPNLEFGDHRSDLVKAGGRE